MRFVLTLALISLALAGCTDANSTDAADSDDTGDSADPFVAPESLHYSGSMQMVASPVAALPSCGQAYSACESHPMTLAEAANVTFILNSTAGTASGAGTPLATDYDLFVFDESGNEQGQTIDVAESETLKLTLEAGTYDLTVRTWQDLDGSYTLDVHFAAPPAPAVLDD